MPRHSFDDLVSAGEEVAGMWLARKFRRPIEKIEEDLMPLVREFCDVDGNWITQKRLRREWKYLKEQSKKQSDRAKARWEKEKEGCRADADGMSSAYAASGNTPTPPPTPPINSTSGKAVNADKRGGRLSSDWQPSAQDRAFAAGLGLDPDFTAHEFRDYWTALPGGVAERLIGRRRFEIDVEILPVGLGAHRRARRPPAAGTSRVRCPPPTRRRLPDGLRQPENHMPQVQS
jgi:hypothetical protein